MNYQKVMGVLVIILGLIGILFALYAKFRVDEVKVNINKSARKMADDSVDQQINEALSKKVREYDVSILCTLAGGIVLILAGTGLLFYWRRK